MFIKTVKRPFSGRLPCWVLGIGSRHWFFQISHQFNQSKKTGTCCTRPFVESTNPIVVEKHVKKRDQLYVFVGSRGFNKLNFGPQAYNVQM